MSEESTTLKTPPPAMPDIGLASDNTDELAKALCEAQATIEQPPKNRVAKVRSRKGAESSFEYRYADLSDVIEAIRKPLAKQGLAYSQALFPVAGKPCLITTLLHVSGQWIRSVYPLPGAMSSQEMGGNITYGRRYSLCALVGVSGETDTDGVAEPPEKFPTDKVRELAAVGLIKSAYDGHKITPEEIGGDKATGDTPLDSEGDAEAAEDTSKLNPALAKAMKASGVSVPQLVAYYVDAGHFPDTMAPEDLPADYVSALTRPGNWKKAAQKMKGA